MESSLENILRDCYITTSFSTHVSLIHPKGKYAIGRENHEKFMTIYCDRIKNGYPHPMGLAEISSEYMPLVVDIDLKVTSESNESPQPRELYQIEQVKEIIEIYQSVIRDTIPEWSSSDLTCVLLEKPPYISGNWIKNGFHLHFPYLFLSKTDTKLYIIPQVKETVKSRNIFSYLNIEDSSSVVDDATCVVPWLMYGSKKSPEASPYLVTKIFNESLEELTMSQAFKDIKIYGPSDNPIDITDNEEYYLPYILSVCSINKTFKTVHNNSNSTSVEIIPAKHVVYTSTTTKQTLIEAKELFAMISDWRADNYHEWINIGWILYNIGEGSDEAFSMWLEFSERSVDKYSESTCTQLWNRMVKKRLTIGSLKYYARIDSPEAYAEYRKKHTENFITKGVDGSHNDIAKVLHSEYSTEFVCASICDKLWYQFNNHRWEEIENGVYLRKRISNQIVSKYDNISHDMLQKANESDDKVAEMMYNQRLKQVQKLIGHLKSHPYKNNVMNEASEEFYDSAFRNKLDQNAHLFAFMNGVYDLNLNIFRNGMPEDYISKTCPIEYVHYTRNSQEVVDVIEFFHKIFPDEQIFNYFMDIYSDIFVGGNNQKKVYLWTGEGDNGKSITQLLFESMLGELSIKFNTQYFTGKKVSTGSANPELSRAAPPVRSAFMEEPDGDEQLNTGELKKLSGGDSFWARDLFQKGKNTREVFPFFMLTFVCNKLPRIRNSDVATWNRLRVIPFESTFVDGSGSCPSSLEEQYATKRFPMDKNLKFKIPKMAQAFAWFLLDWRHQRVKSATRDGSSHVKLEIEEPLKVKEATSEYQKRNDLYKQFIQETIDVDKRGKITITEIYSHFKEWFKEGWPNTQIPIKNEVRDYFTRVWGDPVRFTWKGYKIRTIDSPYDDVDEECKITNNEQVNQECRISEKEQSFQESTHESIQGSVYGTSDEFDDLGDNE